MTVQGEVRYTRDQLRAKYAYNRVLHAKNDLPEKDLKEYKIAVNHFGANVLKNGLVLALAFLARQMDKRKANKTLLEDLAGVEVFGLQEIVKPEYLKKYEKPECFILAAIPGSKKNCNYFNVLTV